MWLFLWVTGGGWDIDMGCVVVMGAMGDIGDMVGMGVMVIRVSWVI